MRPSLFVACVLSHMDPLSPPTWGPDSHDSPPGTPYPAGGRPRHHGPRHCEPRYHSPPHHRPPQHNFRSPVIKSQPKVRAVSPQQLADIRHRPADREPGGWTARPARPARPRPRGSPDSARLLPATSAAPGGSRWAVQPPGHPAWEGLDMHNASVLTCGYVQCDSKRPSCTSCEGAHEACEYRTKEDNRK